MSPSAPPTPDGHSHNQPRPKMQNRRLSIVQDAEVDDLHDIDTHALDGNSPPPHHESSMMSYMESHSPNDESSHKCYPESPLISRQNSVVDEKEVGTGLKASRVEENVSRGRETALGRTPAEIPADTSLGTSEVKEVNTPKTAVDV